MLGNSPAFSGFSVSDLKEAENFYRNILGLNVKSESDMSINLQFTNGGEVFIYLKPDHTPATFTVLNFPVEDIDQAYAELVERGVIFEQYDNMGQDEKGIARADGDGPNIAWFKDPAGNILSIVQ